MKRVFNTTQWKVIAACMMLYTTAYLNRLNLSAALGGIIGDLHMTAAQGGLLQTAFAIVYAAGQMINGAIVDRVDPVRHMLIGLACSGLCNFLMGLAPGYVPLVVLCMLNGVFQSMLWTPILRMVALHFADQKSREKANAIICIALIFGHMGAWALSGYLSGILSWRYSFMTPAVLVIPAVLGGLLLFGGVNRGEQVRKGEKGKQLPQMAGLVKLFASSGFFVMLVACVLYGFVRDGIKTWTPTLLADLGDGDTVAATSFSLLIPLINALGMLVAYRIQQRENVNNRRLIAVMLAVCACFCVPLTGIGSMPLAAVFLGLACACMAGADPALTGLVPIEYDRENLIAMTGGLIDCLIYVGSALAGVLGGMIYEGNGANPLYLCWAAAAVIGAGCSLIAGAMMKRYRQNTK